MKSIPRGFGTPRSPKFYLQSVFVDENTPDKYIALHACTRSQANEQAIALLANTDIDYVLLLRGKAVPGKEKRGDTLADFQREMRPGARQIQ